MDELNKMLIFCRSRLNEMTKLAIDYLPENPAIYLKWWDSCQGKGYRVEVEFKVFKDNSTAEERNENDNQ